MDDIELCSIVFRQVGDERNSMGGTLRNVGGEKNPLDLHD
jgi:hypothetical protein